MKRIINYPTKTIGVIQARMGSCRLPGKVMKKLAGKNLLERIINRMRTVPELDDVVLAAPYGGENDEIMRACREMGVKCIRGEEHDVTARYIKAGMECGAQVIVRITGDNPLTDPGSVSRVVNHLKSYDLDYAVEDLLPIGTCGEAFTLKALLKSYRLADHTAYREHVTLHFKEHRQLYKVGVLMPPEYLRRPDIRLTVDTEEDFYLLNQIFKIMNGTSEKMSLKSVIDLMDNHPDLSSINAGIDQWTFVPEEKELAVI